MSVKIGGVSTLDEMEFKVLKFQHEKLKQRFESRKHVENDLRLKIEQLEKRKMEDDAVINIINRHWNLLDEDIRIILQKLDGVNDEIENDLETSAFLSGGRSELDEKLKNRVMVSKRAVAKILNAFTGLRQRNEKLVLLVKENFPTEIEDSKSIEGTLVKIQEENNRLQAANTILHSKYHKLSLQMKELNDSVLMAETRADDLKNDLDDLYWNKCQLQLKYDKICAQHSEQEQNYRRLEATYARECKKEETNGNHQKVDLMDSEQYLKLQKELEDVKEVSSNRLEELEKLHAQHKETLKEVERLKMRLHQIPEEVLHQTPEFKCLQSKFSVIFNNTMQIVSRFDEFKRNFSDLKTQHLKNIDKMERDELENQIKTKTDLLATEDLLAKATKLYDKAVLECNRNAAENEVLEKLNCEMKKIISSLHSNSKRLKAEAVRYRRKYEELKGLKDKNSKQNQNEVDNSKLNGCTESEECPTSSCYISDAQNKLPCKRSASAEFVDSKDAPTEAKRRLINSSIKQELNFTDTGYTIKVEEKWDQARRDKEKKRQYEYEQRKYLDKKLNDIKVEDQVPADSERLIKELEKDMEVTGQAYEEELEHSQRLVHDIVQKDRANLKLLAENAKIRQLNTLMKQENEILAEKIGTLANQIHQQQDLIRLQNEKDTFLTTEVHLYKREADLRQNAMECQKRKLIENVQIAVDLKIHLEKYQSQMKDAQETIIEKTSSLESEKYKIRRLQEEISQYKKTLERLERIERTGNKDMVLLEEIKEYKELLTCNACQVRRKNAILTKCFHLFCFECLRTRYDTRQRKCPKCNAGFGAKDYHRLFLT